MIKLDVAEPVYDSQCLLCIISTHLRARIPLKGFISIPALLRNCFNFIIIRKYCKETGVSTRISQGNPKEI